LVAQRAEQHCAAFEHGFPRVLHIELSAAQVPPVQVWPQHSPFDVHALPSGVQTG
jgi:hypothetical protein